MKNDVANLDALLEAWPVAAPRTFAPATGGWNNGTWRVDSPDGTFFLRSYTNTNDAARVAYEHALLTHLGAMSLPFRVPVPVPTRAGDTVLAMNGGLAALSSRVPGTHPTRQHPAHAKAAGRALGVLDAALATLDLGPSPHPMYGDLAAIHPLVPDPFAVLDAVPLDRERRARFAALLHATLDAVPVLYHDLPVQIIHGDYGVGNVLLVGEQASGVLDFEFAGPDLRAMDFASGLYYHVLGDGIGAGNVRVEVVEAFVRGYVAATRLRDDELHALPQLLLLLRITGQMHWTGRFLAGLARVADVTVRLDDTLRLADWLAAHGDNFVMRLAEWQRETPYLGQ